VDTGVPDIDLRMFAAVNPSNVAEFRFFKGATAGIGCSSVYNKFKSYMTNENKANDLHLQIGCQKSLQCALSFNFYLLLAKYIVYNVSQDYSSAIGLRRGLRSLIN
jgi:hypothetical protein